MEKIFKVLDCEVKAIGDRKFEFTASTGAIDRDGESIDPLGWDLKNYKKNPVIMYAHDYRSLPVGRSSKVSIDKETGALKNTVQFPPEGTYEFADTVHNLVSEGYLTAESVGFMPKEWVDAEKGDKGATRTYTKQELLEISIVPVPSNPEALLNAVGAGVITQKQFDSLQSGEEHKSAGRKPVSQEEIKDDFDYILSNIKEVGLSEEARETAWDLVREIVRLTGDDIPDDILETIGTVVDNNIVAGLIVAQDYIQDAIDSTIEPKTSPIEDDPEPTPEPEPAPKQLSVKDVASIVAGVVKEAIEKAQGKV